MTGANGNISLLLSKDGICLAQFSTYDIAGDPRTKVPSEDRPARGEPATAPVIVVGFDDLEYPFCAQLKHVMLPSDGQVIVQSEEFLNVESEGHPIRKVAGLGWITPPCGRYTYCQA